MMPFGYWLYRTLSKLEVVNFHSSIAFESCVSGLIMKHYQKGLVWFSRILLMNGAFSAHAERNVPMDSIMALFEECLYPYPRR
jgi:hypothetical protein